MSVPDDERRSLWQIVPDTGSIGCKTAWSRHQWIATCCYREFTARNADSDRIADFCRLPDCAKLPHMIEVARRTACSMLIEKVSLLISVATERVSIV